MSPSVLCRPNYQPRALRKADSGGGSLPPPDCTSFKTQ